MWSTIQTPRTSVVIDVDPNSDRLQLLEPFAAWEGTDLKGLKLLKEKIRLCQMLLEMRLLVLQMVKGVISKILW